MAISPTKACDGHELCLCPNEAPRTLSRHPRPTASLSQTFSFHLFPPLDSFRGTARFWEMAAVADELTAIFERMEAPCAVREIAGQGKCVVATRDLPAGDVLFEESPLLCWVFADQYSLTDDEVAAASSSGSAIRPCEARCRHCLGPIRSDSATLTLPAASAPPSSDGTDRSVGDSAPRFCSSRCASLNAGLEWFIRPPVEPALRGFQLKHHGRTGEMETPITVEALARCVAWIAARYLRTSASNPTATVPEVFAAATAPFNRFVQPPDDATLEGIDPAVWFARLRRVLRPAVEKGGQDGRRLPGEAIDALFTDATLTTLLGQLALNSQALNIQSSHAAAAPPEPLAPAEQQDTAIDAHPSVPPSCVSAGAGLFTLQSCFNHSCRPNCFVRFGRDSEVALVTKRPVRVGEQLTITYINELYLALENVTQRRDRLAPYMFECACERCISEAATAASHVDPSNSAA